MTVLLYVLKFLLMASAVVFVFGAVVFVFAIFNDKATAYLIRGITYVNGRHGRPTR